MKTILEVIFLTFVLTLTAMTQTTTPGTEENNSVTSAIPDTTVLIDPAKIYNENPMGWVGKNVILKNVTVQDTNHGGNFWVGLDDHHRLLIVKQPGNDNLKAITVHKGDVVTISGAVQAASRYRAQSESAEQGSMSDAQKSSGVFVLANDVTVASSTHR